MKLNFWPFNRPKALTAAEFSAAQPPAPCGEQETHYGWQYFNGMPCPRCSAIKLAKRKDAELDALADKIVARLRSSASPSAVSGGGES